MIDQLKLVLSKYILFHVYLMVIVSSHTCTIATDFYIYFGWRFSILSLVDLITKSRFDYKKKNYFLFTHVQRQTICKILGWMSGGL